MRGHNVCFYGAIRKIIPKLPLLPLLIWTTAVRETVQSSYVQPTLGVSRFFSKPYPMCANSKGSDQTEHMPRLVEAFAVCICLAPFCACHTQISLQ